MFMNFYFYCKQLNFFQQNNIDITGTKIEHKNYANYTWQQMAPNVVEVY